MTVPESVHSDPEIQAEWEYAAAALARIVRPYMQEAFVGDVVERFMRGLRARGWKPPLKPRELPQPPPADPAATAALGAQRVREELDAALGRPDQEGQ